MSRHSSQAILIALAFAGFMVWNLTGVFEDFFLIDDALNQNLPFYREMGRLWLAGEIPILTERAFVGGNMLFDLLHGTFLPQVIVTSIIAASTEDPRLPASVFAFLNFALAFLGGYAFARALRIEHGAALTVGLAAGGAPVFVHVYQASWWNLAVSHAWLFLALAALIAHVREPSPRRLVIAVVAGALLATSGGTQAHVVYGTAFVILSGLRFAQTRSIREAASVWLPAAIIGLVAAGPWYAEHLLLRGVALRPSVYSNAGDFLVTPWGALLNFFNPFYAEHFVLRGGYRYVDMAPVYSGIALLVFLFFGRFRRELTTEKLFLLILSAVLVLLAFSAYRMGLLRFPFRFAPFLSVCIAATVVSFFPLEATDRPGARRLWPLLVFGVYAALLQWFSAEGPLFAPLHLLFVVLFLALVGVIAVAARSGALDRRPALVCVGIGLVALLPAPYKLPTMGERFVYYTRLPDRIPLTPSGPDCAELSLAGQIWNGRPGHDRLLTAAQPLLSGTKTLGGYSPVGDGRYGTFLPHDPLFGEFDTAKAFERLFAPTSFDPGTTPLELLDVCRIFVPVKDAPADLVPRAQAAGMTIAPYVEGILLLSRPDPRPEGTLTYPSDPSIRFEGRRGARFEAYAVPPAEDERRLVFARLYWPGYAATLDGRPLRVDMLDDLLVAVTVPAKASGRLEVTYSPVTLGMSYTSMLAGILLLGFVLRRMGRARSVDREPALQRNVHDETP